MSNSNFFPVQWDQKLLVITVVSSIILIGATILVARLALTRTLPPAIRVVLSVSATITFSVFIGGILLSPRGYRIRESSLCIMRWLCPIGIPIAAIKEVGPLPREYLAGSLRMFGSGGFFGYYGRHQNQKLGKYLIYATRSDGYVFVRANCLYVLTPDSPEKFVEALNLKCGFTTGKTSSPNPLMHH